jgi:hypothetical protein
MLTEHQKTLIRDYLRGFLSPYQSRTQRQTRCLIPHYPSKNKKKPPKERMSKDSQRRETVKREEHPPRNEEATTYDNTVACEN